MTDHLRVYRMHVSLWASPRLPKQSSTAALGFRRILREVAFIPIKDLPHTVVLAKILAAQVPRLEFYGRRTQVQEHTI